MVTLFANPGEPTSASPNFAGREEGAVQDFKVSGSSGTEISLCKPKKTGPFQ
jgi:hypothetical protein